MTSSSLLVAGQIAENFFMVAGRESVIVVKVLGQLDNGQVRVADLRDCSFGKTAQQLIRANKTWAVPAENLRGHDADCQYCHKQGLVTVG